MGGRGAITCLALQESVALGQGQKGRRKKKRKEELKQRHKQKPARLENRAANANLNKKVPMWGHLLALGLRLASQTLNQVDARGTPGGSRGVAWESLGAFLGFKTGTLVLRSPTKRNGFRRKIYTGGPHTNLFIKEEKFSSFRSGGPGGAAPWSKNLNHFLPSTSEQSCP